MSADVSDFNRQLEEKFPETFKETDNVDRVFFLQNDGRYCLDGTLPLYVDIPSDMADYLRTSAHDAGRDYEEYLTERLMNSVRALVW